MTVLHLVAKYACAAVNVCMPAGKGVGMKGDETRGFAVFDYEKGGWLLACQLLRL